MRLIEMVRDFREFVALRRTKQPQHERHGSWGWGRADAGVVVTEDVAMQESTANACATLISRTIATLPAKVLAPRGGEEDGNQHLGGPIEALVHVAPNPEMGAFQFRESLLLSAIFQGNGLAEIERDGMGNAIALWPLPWQRAAVCRHQSGELYYEIDNGDGKVELGPREVFHLKGPTWNGTVGLSLIDYARHTLGLAVAQERYASAFIRNQGAPSGVVKIKKNITEAGLTRMKAEIQQLYAGPRNAGRIAFLDNDSEWETVGVTPQDGEFLAQRRFSVEAICRFFGVPPQMIGDTSKQTFANFEQAGLNFLALAILPWVVRFEQECNRKLFAVARPGKPQPFVKLNTAAIVRANLEARYRAYALGRQWGWLSVNKILQLEDMEPIGPEGDVYLTPMNMEPVPRSPEDDAGNDDDVDRARRARDLVRV